MFEKVREKLRELGRLTPMALVSTFMPAVGSATLIVFILPIGHWLRENWEIGIAGFILGMFVFCGLALLPTNVIGVVSGWAFGFEVGLSVLMIGVMGAALISFMINSRLSGEHLSKAIAKHPRSSAIYHALLQDDIKKTTLIIILLRMSVVMPFALTNFLMAASRVSLKAYVIGTAVGMLPRSTAVAFVGSGLSELNTAESSETTMLMVGIAATVGAVIIIAILSRRALERLTRIESSAEA